MSRFHPLPDLALLRQRVGAATRELLSLHTRLESQQDDRRYYRRRQALVQHIEHLGLHAPFAWQTYVDAVLRAYRSQCPTIHIEVVPTYLPQGTSARWVVVSSATATADTVESATFPRAEVRNSAEKAPRSGEQLSSIRASLLITKQCDEAYIERAVYHEMGHLELGHLAEVQPVTDVLQRAWTSHATPTKVAHVEPQALEARHEHEAERFATALMRLAHGWDPALLVAPRLNDFFNVMR